jgi:hypothetical protein
MLKKGHAKKTKIISMPKRLEKKRKKKKKKR